MTFDQILNEGYTQSMEMPNSGAIDEITVIELEKEGEVFYTYNPTGEDRGWVKPYQMK